MAEINHIGKYELLEELGRGGFATVYKARDNDLDRIVALKVLHPYWTADLGFAARFRREAKTVARLRHPHIVTVYEEGEAENQLYIAMEYLTGCTLQEFMETEGKFTLERALPILSQIADALDYAHTQNVIHRDVKPANVIVEGSDGEVHAVLTDFGLVKAMAKSTVLTSLGTLLGSPEYMAPEQVDPEHALEVGPAVDSYAFGVVAYQMFTGRVPFPGNTPATLYAHVYQPVPSPYDQCPDLPESAAVALLKMLAKAPEERFPSAGAFVAALQEAWEAEAKSRQRTGQLKPLRIQLQAAADSEDWVAVLELGGKIGNLDADDPEVAALVRRAREQLYYLQARQSSLQPVDERAGELASLYKKAREAAAVEDWPTVVGVGERLSALDAEYRDMPALLQQAYTHLHGSSEEKIVGEKTLLLPQEEQNFPLIVPTTPSTGVSPWIWVLGVIIVLGVLGTMLKGVIPNLLVVEPSVTPSNNVASVTLSNVTPSATSSEVTPSPNLWTRPKDGMVMVRVPAGEFYMGTTGSVSNEGPVHAVTLDEFWMDKTEVTNAQYGRCVMQGICEVSGYARNTDFNGDSYPVVGVSWDDAIAYCGWVGGELPTEAEWEYASRGVKGWSFPWGSSFNCSRGNFDDETTEDAQVIKGEVGCDTYDKTAPVGSFLSGASWCGALDLSGNVSEWVADWYYETYSPVQQNPTGPASGFSKVVRGGSWRDDMESYLRGAYRNRSDPRQSSNNLGFRCVLRQPPNISE